MSDTPSSPTPPPPPRVLPVHYPPPPPPPPRPSGGGGRLLLALLLFGSLALNLVMCGGGLLLRGLGSDEDSALAIRERFHSGASGAADKVAVVQIDGTIMEGMLSYPHKQIERAAGDSRVKAVVVRIVSPGGTITASDDLYRRLVHLRDGTTPKFQSGGNTAPKPLVVSMGALAASGGYYIAMPAQKTRPDETKVFAEPTTITGSIGVYASFPDVHKFTDEHGIAMKTIKAGAIKASGSPFHEMTPQERQPWDDMVSHAYDQFLTIVAKGRPPLTPERLAHEVVKQGEVPLTDDRGNVVTGEDGKPKTAHYTRVRADGGIFTADEAKRYGLVDAVGTLDDAIAEVARQAGLTKYRAVTYDRPLSLSAALFGSADAPPRQAGGLDLGKLADGLGPRVWYLLPQAGPSALLQAAGRE